MRPIDLGLPFDSFRAEQLEALDFFEKNPDKDLVLEAPTGIGKTLIATAYLRKAHKRGLILTANKSLQDQYVKQSGGLVKTVYGRNNYPCVLPEVSPDDAANLGVVDGITTAANAPCTQGYRCRFKSQCPYFEDKTEAQNAQITVLNYNYFFSEEEYVGSFKDFDTLICDEAHLIDGILNRFMETKVLTPTNTNLQLRELYGNFDKRFVDRSDVWVNCGNDLWRPLISNIMPYLRKRNIFMSATVSASILEAELGLMEGNLIQYNLPYVFSPLQRPILYRPVVNLNRNNKVPAAKALANAIDYVIKAHPGERGIIHSNSYELQEEISKTLPDRVKAVVLEQTRGMERAEALRRFRADTRPIWLLSPAMTHGEDFPDDIARCQIICKIPFPDLGDPIIHERVYGNRFYRRASGFYYNKLAAQSFTQTCGRIVRNEKDYGETIVLDGEFENIRGQLADGITEAVIYV